MTSALLIRLPPLLKNQEIPRKSLSFLLPLETFLTPKLAYYNSIVLPPVLLDCGSMLYHLCC